MSARNLGDGAKLAIVAVVTCLATIGLSLLQGMFWDSALESPDATLVVTFLCGLGLGWAGYMAGALWYYTWADQ